MKFNNFILRTITFLFLASFVGFYQPAMAEERGWLGVEIQEFTPELAKSLKVPFVEGVHIGKVIPDGPASKAGLRKGDVILEFKRQEVTKVDDLVSRIAATKPSENALFLVSRKGRTVFKIVKLGKRIEKKSQILESKTATELYDIGFEHYSAGKMHKAEKWLRMAAERNHPAAQYFLGTMYINGIGGLSKDPQKRFYWNSKAAEQGFAPAQTSLGLGYLIGKPPFSKDYSKAKEWFSKAAEQGDSGAQAELGEMYFYGEGVPQDREKGIELLRLSAEQGDKYGSAKGILEAHGIDVAKSNISEKLLAASALAALIYGMSQGSPDSGSNSNSSQEDSEENKEYNENVAELNECIGKAKERIVYCPYVSGGRSCASLFNRCNAYDYMTKDKPYCDTGSYFVPKFNTIKEGIINICEDELRKFD